MTNKKLIEFTNHKEHVNAVAALSEEFGSTLTIFKKNQYVVDSRQLKKLNDRGIKYSVKMNEI